MIIGFELYLFFLLSQIAVVIMAISSWYSKLFLPSQVFRTYWRAGINFATHGGMWGDMFLLPPLLTYMFGHSEPMSLGRDWLFAVIGVSLTVLNHMMLIANQRPDPLGFTELKWSTAIAVHAVYMAVYIAIIGHFYFNAVGASRAAIVAVSILLGIHVAAGTHVFLGMANLVKQWVWCPDILGDKALPVMNGAVWLLLSGFAGYAGGFRAAFSVLLSGLLFGVLVVLFVVAVNKARQLHLIG